MRFKKRVKLVHPRKTKKKIIKTEGRLFYKLKTSRLVIAIIKTQDRRILPSLLTNNNLEQKYKISDLWK